jgi:hypothetical protein
MILLGQRPSGKMATALDLSVFDGLNPLGKIISPSNPPPKHKHRITINK